MGISVPLQNVDLSKGFNFETVRVSEMKRFDLIGPLLQNVDLSKGFNFETVRVSEMKRLGF